MKPVTEVKKRKAPVVIRDKELDKYDDVVLFPKKVEEAKKTIARAGVPKRFRPNAQ